MNSMNPEEVLTFFIGDDITDRAYSEDYYIGGRIIGEYGVPHARAVNEIAITIESLLEKVVQDTGEIDCSDEDRLEDAMYRSETIKTAVSDLQQSIEAVLTDFINLNPDKLKRGADIQFEPEFGNRDFHADRVYIPFSEIRNLIQEVVDTYQKSTPPALLVEKMRSSLSTEILEKFPVLEDQERILRHVVGMPPK